MDTTLCQNKSNNISRRAAEAARANRVVKAAKVELTAQQARVTQAELAVITTTTGVTGEVYRED